MKWRYELYRIVESHEDSYSWSRWFDRFITLLILLNVIAISLETFQEINARYGNWLNGFEDFSVIVFSVEYLGRLLTADFQYPRKHPVQPFLRYVFSFKAIIDLLAVLPYYLPMFIAFDLRFLRGLRLLRLLRVLKLSRYTLTLRIVMEVIREKKMDLEVTLLATFLLLVISSNLMYAFEHEVQPEAFDNILSSFWWAIATLTTIGYGDIYPITGWGRLLSGIIAILGIGMVALPAGILSASFLQKMKQKEEDKHPAPPISKPGVHAHDSFNFCPYCGKRLKDAENARNCKNEVCP